jgi:hypothetical protein
MYFEVFEYINASATRKKRYSSLGFRSPVQFEWVSTKKLKAAA